MPDLDLAAIERRADEWILSSVDRRELAYTLINTDIPALVARVRALEAENAALRDALEPLALSARAVCNEASWLAQWMEAADKLLDLD